MSEELEAIQEKLKAIIANNLVMEVEEIKPQSRYLEDLGLDSLDQLELIQDIEMDFEVDIQLDEFHHPENNNRYRCLSGREAHNWSQVKILTRRDG